LYDDLSTVIELLVLHNSSQSLSAVDRVADADSKAKFHYASWSQTGPRPVADLLARASSLLAS